MPRTIDPVVTTFGEGDQPAFDLGDGLTLRPFALSDASFVRGAFADPAIIRWHHFRIDTSAEASAWIDRTRDTWEAASKADWLIDEHGAGMGRVGIHVDPLRGTAEIAYWLTPAGRGRGLATRSAGRVTAWAHAAGFHRIVLQHSTRNDASCAVADRLGYCLEGTACEAERHADDWHDLHLHAHLASDPLP